ncbi:MAG TPA: zinc ribbon domain-containing protein [Gemmatimonadaceae bacterium]|nr:zinc ribbon domain-containing protein [Gemmatimonadaceae bacterium]
MPTYEFRCPAGHDVEKFFKISEAPSEVECPTCGAVAARRISGGAGLVFKGSGFYITDYGKDGKKDLRQATASSAKSESGGGDGGSGAGGGKSESPAPAAATPAKAGE